jgi:hypothetical protein
MDRELQRIEHKIDILLRSLMRAGLVDNSIITQLSESSELSCPVCEAEYRWTIDVQNEREVMSCDCSPPVKAVKGISALLNPPKQEVKHERSTSGSGRGGDSPSPDQEGKR